MSDMLLAIHRRGQVFSPPVIDGIELEQEKSGSPSKLTFTTVRIGGDGYGYVEGDKVTFSYKGKMIFVGYIFSKSRDRKQHIKVTCYDQTRYLKNKFSYVFEKKTADKIIKSLCDDFKMNIGTLAKTNYVIPSIAEENTTAFDIILKVLEDTLTNTGKMFIFYDDAGKLMLKDASKMVCKTVIDPETASNFDYSSTIDEDVYNNIVLYYKNDDNKIIPYTSSNKKLMEQWGNLRYFEEVKVPAIAKNKAKALLDLYARKKRELKIKDAFGSIEVRAGCLIPVQLHLGDIKVNNYMQVQKVTHKFKRDNYTMDITLEGAWED